MGFNEAMRKVNCDFRQLTRSSPFIGFKEAVHKSVRDAVLSREETHAINQYLKREKKCEDGIHCPRTLAGAPAGVPHFLYHIPPYGVQVLGRAQAGGTTSAAGRVYLHAVQVPVTLTISGLVCFYWSVAAGNFRLGIYGPDTALPPAAAGNALLGESASTPCVGTNRAHYAALSGGNRQISAGLYWLAHQPDNGTDTWGYNAYSSVEVSGDHFRYGGDYYDNPGGYGAFANPCPALTAHTAPPMILLRVVSVP